MGLQFSKLLRYCSVMIHCVQGSMILAPTGSHIVVVVVAVGPSSIPLRYSHLYMDVPVFNKGHYLYTVKLNVSVDEHTMITQYRWFKLHGQPWNKTLGSLFKFVSDIISFDGLILHASTELIPIFYKTGICVAYSQIDHDDYELLSPYKWFVNSQGYAITKGSILMHRLLTNHPIGLVVDHIFWNKLDNRRSMLRGCTISENSKNMPHRRPEVCNKKLNETPR